jgi:peptidoglycan/LPS O-acetylase OafA/YrhL
VLLLVLGVSLAWRAGYMLTGIPSLGRPPLQLGAWRMWPFTHWFSWVLGAVAAEAYTGATVLPRFWYRYRVAFVCLAFCVLSNARTLAPLMGQESGGWGKQAVRAVSGLSDFAFVLGAFVVLNVWVTQEVRGKFRGWVVRPLAAIGFISYSLYLTHQPILDLCQYLLPLGGGLASFALRCLLYVPACLAFGLLFFLAVERRFLNKPRPQPAPQKTVGAPPPVPAREKSPSVL